MSTPSPNTFDPSDLNQRMERLLNRGAITSRSETADLVKGIMDNTGYRRRPSAKTAATAATTATTTDPTASVAPVSVTAAAAAPKVALTQAQNTDYLRSILRSSRATPAASSTTSSTSAVPEVAAQAAAEPPLASQRIPAITATTPPGAATAAPTMPPSATQNQGAVPQRVAHAVVEALDAGRSVTLSIRGTNFVYDDSTVRAFLQREPETTLFSRLTWTVDLNSFEMINDWIMGYDLNLPLLNDSNLRKRFETDVRRFKINSLSEQVVAWTSTAAQDARTTISSMQMAATGIDMLSQISNLGIPSLTAAYQQVEQNNPELFQRMINNVVFETEGNPLWSILFAVARNWGMQFSSDPGAFGAYATSAVNSVTSRFGANISLNTSTTVPTGSSTEPINNLAGDSDQEEVDDEDDAESFNQALFSALRAAPVAVAPATN
jgi:hypothetical protein